MFERRTARLKLAKSIEIVEAYHSRLNQFMDKNLEYKPKPSSTSLFGISNYSSNSSYGKNDRSPETHIIVISEDKMQELLKLKKEFETEFKIAQGYADILKPQFFDDGSAAYDAKLKFSLGIHAQTYSMIFDMISKFDMYTKK